MKTTHTNQTWARNLIAALVLVAGASVAMNGCGSSKNPTPPTGTGGSSAGGSGGGGGGSGGSSAGGAGGSAAGGAGGGATDGGTDGGTDSGTDGPVTGDGGGDGPPVGQPGCYAPKPTDRQTVQFLNACTGTTCFPFDNRQRLPADLYVNGTLTLPPLP